MFSENSLFSLLFLLLFKTELFSFKKILNIESDRIEKVEVLEKLRLLATRCFIMMIALNF